MEKCLMRTVCYDFSCFFFFNLRIWGKSLWLNFRKRIRLLRITDSHMGLKNVAVIVWPLLSGWGLVGWSKLWNFIKWYVDWLADWAPLWFAFALAHAFWCIIKSMRTCIYIFYAWHCNQWTTWQFGAALLWRTGTGSRAWARAGWHVASYKFGTIETWNEIIKSTAIFTVPMVASFPSNEKIQIILSSD